MLSTPSPEVSEYRLLVLRLKRDKISSKALSSSKPGHPHCPHHLSDTSGQANSGFHYLLLCQMWSLIFLGSLWHSRGLRSVALLGQLWRGGGGGLNHENQVRDKMWGAAARTKVRTWTEKARQQTAGMEKRAPNQSVPNNVLNCPRPKQLMTPVSEVATLPITKMELKRF